MEIEKLSNRNDLDCIEITEEDGKYEGDVLIDPNTKGRFRSQGRS